MDVDAIIDRLLGDLFLPLVLGLASAIAYLAVLARAHEKTRALVGIAEECRRRRLEGERREARIGYSPGLGRYRRLEAELLRRIRR